MSVIRMSINKLRTLRNRLDAWRKELETNNNDLQHVAPEKIKLLEAEIKCLEKKDNGKNS